MLLQRLGNRLSMLVCSTSNSQGVLTPQWMGEWDAPQKASLLLEVIKLCDKELLGYLVQCLHQRYTSQLVELVVEEKGH